MSAADVVSIRWKWIEHVSRWWRNHGPCDSYVCQWTNHGRGLELGDVKRCRWHNRLQVVKHTDYSTDSNGGHQLVRWKRLRPWRLGYWRARRMLARAAAVAPRETKDNT